MVPYRIVIVDLNTLPCPEGGCDRLASLIPNCLPAGEIDLQAITALPIQPVRCAADLILFRPPSGNDLPEGTDSLRKTWGQVPILGLFCDTRTTNGDIPQSILNDLDDFLYCPFWETELFSRIRRLLPRRNTAAAFQPPHPIKGRLPWQTLVGNSESFLSVTRKIPVVAHSDSTVLILGETGTGKELIARAVHEHSRRRQQPFIAVNCGALPDYLFENELFGHAKGAFTDAGSPEKGLVAEAEGGTLLLDEIDALSGCAQIKLLRFLQDHEYRPLGCAKSMVADVRILAASNTDLQQLVQAKRFRDDLYYRLNVLTFHLPSLRERIEDIPLLTAHFLARYRAQYGREPLALSHGVMEKLMAYPWPGNIRELEGVIERAVLLASGPELRPDDIDLFFDSGREVSEGGSFRTAKTRVVEQFERAFLANLLAAHQGNITRAAKAAGKERRAFQRLLRKHRLDRYTFHS